MERPNLRCIADTLGISVNAVSRALSGKDGVGDPLRRRIQAEAERIGYVPNQHARSLVHRSTLTLGFVISNLSNPLHTALLAAVQARARELGYSLLLGASQEDPVLEADSIEALLRWRVDGILIVPVGPMPEVVSRLLNTDAPLVFVHHRGLSTANADLVAPDNATAAYQAIRHVLGLGHQRIAMLLGDLSLLPNIRRRQGALRAMSEAAIEASEDMFIPIILGPPGLASPIWNPDAAYRTCKEICQRSDRPTAVIVAHEFFALGVYRALAELGLGIPKDISVVAFGEPVISQYLVPSLTTVSASEQDVGIAAVDLLLDRIRQEGREGTPPPSLILVEPTLVVRGSSGPAPVPRHSGGGPGREHSSRALSRSSSGRKEVTQPFGF